MSLDLDAMTEDELRSLNRTLARERGRDDVTIGKSRELRTQMLRINDALSLKQAKRVKEYQHTAATTPGALSTTVGAAAAGAASVGEVPV